MTESRILNALGQTEDVYILEASPLHDSPKTASARFRRRLPVILIAALLTLFLLGAGVAAVIYGDSIQSWFGHAWERDTGRPMSGDQTAVIDHLSQEIGLSRTVDGVTVTVDSATVGDDMFHLLVRIEGLDASRRYSYSFDDYHVELDPDPVAGGGMGGLGWHYLGLDGDGAVLLLFHSSFASHDGYQADTSPLTVTLHFDHLTQGGPGNDKLLAAGPWDFTFTLDRSRLPDPVSLPDTAVTAYNMDGELVTTQLTGIELTSTGIRFQYDYEASGGIDFGYLVEAPAHITEMNGTLLIRQAYVILDNGLIAEFGGGTGVPLKDSGLFSLSLRWAIPLNLDEVAAIQIGETQIPMPPVE